ncbi:NADH:flavin oxidoreductase [Pseudonocardia sp. MH-G8]|uniref:NADH:flavin oxidoreductase n=1 Tax=Pseudonocardia sp. MH-G8 TaxID=1854588 RepID=UPI000BA1511B|nr:NADH:flavin oxidoreductase [Pseudonocardia sp. MH-G8]OZM77935.1 hypothetical protein CFP66_33265 [Pseudonocardia sp. MH-G8]
MQPADLMFRPIRIGTVEIPNRIVLPSMTTRYATREGFATDETVGYYRARARGGVGLVTVEMAAPEVAGRHRFHELGIYDDKFLPGLTRIVEAIHAEGARASIQLGHGGSRARRAVSGTQPVSASSMPVPVFEIEHEIARPEAMTENRIDEAVRAFVEAAQRARAAGFDVVELHASHGYLISQFLCPAENDRTDAYGGSLENRARFGLRILTAVKAAVPDLPVIFRITVDDLFPEGLPFAEGLQVAIWAAEASADAISVTAGHYRSVPGAERMIPPMAYPDGAFLDFAAAVKKEVHVPVIGVGRLGNPAVATAALAEEKLDLVAIGRPLIADASWPAKVRAGRPVRRCLACNHCVNNMRGGNVLSCVVNPLTGHENDFREESGPRGRRILVIGAGPAGLSYAALVAGQNEVTVVESEGRAGGAFRWTGKAPLFNDVEAADGTFDAYIGELESECRRLGVDFRFGTRLTRDSPLLADADTVVLATGARYRGRTGPVVRAVLRSGRLKSATGRKVFADPRLRDLFYYRARAATGASVRRELGLATDDRREVIVIGDAAAPGKAREAIGSAFAAALDTKVEFRR